jgi:Lar family restriction alleviation protein
LTDMNLLPCPFCGKDPVVRRLVEEYPADDKHPAGEYEVHVTICCDGCGFEIGEEYKADAIAAWNRRSPSPAPVTPTKVTEQMVRAVHEALGGDGWAYSNYGHNELRDRRPALEDAVRAILALLPSSGPEGVEARGKPKVKATVITALREWAEFEQDGGNVEQGAAIDAILDWYESWQAT